MVGFPEISMYQCDPWGGYGANPLPAHLQSLWDQAKEHLAGGFPYSEGIYEDINKAICAQFYWNKSAQAADVVREYAAFEYSPEVVDDVTAAIDILERNLPRSRRRGDEGGELCCEMKHVDGAEEAFVLLQRADAKLSPQARSAWRWRILYLRALIDRELALNEGRISEPCQEAFDELTTIYHADRALDWVAPPKPRGSRRPARFVD